MAASDQLVDYLVADMMKKENYATYKKDEGGNTNKGDGYLGDINFVQVIACKSGIRRPYKIVIKSARSNEEFRTKVPIRECFAREILLYSKLFPSYLELQQEYFVDVPINIFAKCYTTCLEPKMESVVLQDLRSVGFELHNRLVTMNLNHVHMVFQNYGKLHGLSLALRYKKPTVFNNLTKNMSDLFGIFMTQTKMIPPMTKDFKSIMQILEKRGRIDLVKKYEKCKFMENIDTIATKSTNPKDLGSVVLHGDCWNNNFMFKYEALSKDQPTDMVFIDFQLSRVASPVYDLSYFFYACCDNTVLQHLPYLLQVYHRSLRHTLEQFALNVDDYLSFEKLLDHWRIYGKYGLAMSLFIVRVELTDPSEAPDFAEDTDDFLRYPIRNQVIYDRRVADNYIHFAEHYL